MDQCYSVFALASYSFEVLSIAVNFGLVPVDLLLLAVIRVLVALELIADQGTGTQSQTAADCGSSPGMSDGRTDKTTRSRAAERADAGALLACT